MSQSNEALLPFSRAVDRPREKMFFAIAVLILVVALWSIPKLSFADGAVHTAMAHLLTALWQGGAPDLARYFELNIQLEPNWFIYPILVGLMQVVDQHTAEKILLTGYVIALPYSFRYAVSADNPDNATLGWYALPFVFSWPLNLGLYNFIFSIPWMFVTLGYLARHWRDLTAGRTALLVLLSMLTYFSHITSALVLVLVVGSFGAWLLYCEYLSPKRLRPVPGQPAAVVRTVVMMALTVIPVAALILMFALRNAGQEVEYGPDPWYRFKMLAYGNPILSHTRWEGLFAMPVALLPAAAAAALLYRRWTGRGGLLPADGLLAGALVVTLFGFVIPNSTSGGGLAVQRIQVYPYLLVMLWVGMAADWAPLRRAVLAVGVAATAGLLAINMAYNHIHSRYVAEFESVGPLLKPGEAVLLLDFTGWYVSPDGGMDSFRMNFIGHPQSRFVAEYGVVDLNLYQASTPNFPVKYRFETDPYIHLRGWGPHPETPPHDEFLMAHTRSDIRVDAVLVWGLTPEREAWPRSDLQMEQLAAGYELLHTSENGWMRLYRRKAP